jgi:hypothetical protein
MLAVVFARPALAGSFDCGKLKFYHNIELDGFFNFGKVPVGKTDTATITVKNNDLHFSADIATIEVMPTPPFAIVDANTTCKKGEFAPQAKCDVQVTCTPQEEGKFKGELTFSSTIERCKKQGIKLKCQGVAPVGTPTATATATPTMTATPTVSATPTATATATKTATATTTRTATATATVATATPTITATATRTATATATVSGTPTVTATPTPVPATYGGCTNTSTLAFQNSSTTISGDNVAIGGLNGTSLVADLSADGGKTFVPEVTLAPDTDQVIPPQCDLVGAILYCLYEDTVHTTVKFVSYDTVGKTVTGPFTAISDCTFPALLPYTTDIYAACSNSDGIPYSTSTNSGTTWSTSVLALSGNFAVPTITGGFAGTVFTGQGVTSGNAQNIVGTLFKGGTFGTPFDVFTAGSSMESVFFGPPNTFLANNNLVIFGADTGPSSSFAFSAWGNVTATTPFQTTTLATGFRSVAGFLPNPPATNAAVIGISSADGSTSILQGDVTIPGSFTSLSLGGGYTFTVSAAGNLRQGVFATTDGANSTKVWRCIPAPPPP